MKYVILTRFNEAEAITPRIPRYGEDSFAG